MTSSICSEIEDSPSGRRLYILVWCNVFTCNSIDSLPPTRLLVPFACEQIIPYQYVQPSSWRWTLVFEKCRRRRKN